MTIGASVLQGSTLWAHQLPQASFAEAVRRHFHFVSSS